MTHVLTCSQLPKWKVKLLRIQFRIFQTLWGTKPDENYGLFWDKTFLKVMGIDGAIKLPMEYLSRFADRICRDKVDSGQLLTRELPQIGDEISLDYINVTGLGNMAYAYMHCNDLDVVELAGYYLARVKEMVNAGHRVGVLV